MKIPFTSGVVPGQENCKVQGEGDRSMFSANDFSQILRGSRNNEPQQRGQT